MAQCIWGGVVTISGVGCSGVNGVELMGVSSKGDCGGGVPGGEEFWASGVAWDVIGVVGVAGVGAVWETVVLQLFRLGECSGVWV